MSSADNNVSLRKTARLTGALYFIWILTGLFSLMYVPSHTMVHGDAVGTAKKMLANEFLFRTSLINNIASSAIWVVLVLLLHRIFKKVNERTAKLLVALVIVQIPVAFVMGAFDITALMIFKGEILQTFEPIRRQDIAMLFLKVNDNATTTLIMFWGLWLLPLGQLVYKSGFIPRIFGWCLFIGGIGWIIDSIVIFLFPSYSPFISTYVMATGTIGEIPIMLWFLIMGVKNNYVKN